MPGTDRLHALDAVRAFALLAGIVLHATMSFAMPVPAPDVSQSTTLAGAFFVIHIFRMSAFYFIAGFFARMSFHRKGLGGFARDRGKRIAIPLVAGWIILAPLTIAAAAWGAYRTYGPEVLEQTAGISLDTLPLVHLWFLYYLLMLYVGALVLRAVIVSVDRSGSFRSFIDRMIAALSKSYLLPVVLALPVGLLLYYQADWAVWGGIPTPDTGFTPEVGPLVGFGTAFGFGWLVHRQIGLLNEWRRRWHVYIGAAAILSVVAVSIVGVKPDFSAMINPAEPIMGSERVIYTTAYMLALWCWTIGLVGAAMRFCSNVSPVRRYLADSSYWMYLWHLPIIFALQVWLAPWEMHWTVKFPLILGVTVAILLVSYEYLVRHGFLGALLNGRRIPRAGRERLSGQPV